MSKATRIIITIFGGWFGLHKYMDGKIGMGILYTCTAGLFYIGWIYDIIQAFKMSSFKESHVSTPSKSFGKVTSTTTKYNPKASQYKMETLEDIESIPVPTQKFEYNCDFTQSIEYVLQRKATQFKKEGNLELAIACLKKSNEIMPFAPMMYTEKDYGRLKKYLKLAGKFDEAREAQDNRLLTLFKQNEEIKEKHMSLSDLSDYIEVSRSDMACSECAKYHDRIYSKNGMSGFPDLKTFLDYENSKSCGCYLPSFPFYYGISEPMLSKSVSAIEYSNRPFVDDRTPSEKKLYNERQKKMAQDIKDRSDYDWLCEHIPDIAPKSFSGYRNMKNKNSANYQKLVSLAKEKGLSI